MQPNNPIRIALQKTGRLARQSQALLEQWGINAFPVKNQLFVQDISMGVDVFFARDDDIPRFVDLSMCDFGIVGRNVLEEYCASQLNETLEILAPLGFSKCQLSLAAPKGYLYQGACSLEGKTIATSYPNILKKFLLDNQINANIIVMQGCVELAPVMGIADVICDLVATGTTLRENGLEKFMTVMESEAVLIRNKENLNTKNKSFFEELFSDIRYIPSQNNETVNQMMVGL